MTVSAPYFTASSSFATSSGIDGRDGGITDVRVDLHARDFPDAHGLEDAGKVPMVGGNDESAASHFIANQLRGDPFALGHKRHGGRDIAMARERHLRGTCSHLSDSLRRCEPDQVQRDSLSRMTPNEPWHPGQRRILARGCYNY
jgi:hypothetical protein